MRSTGEQASRRAGVRADVQENTGAYNTGSGKKGWPGGRQEGRPGWAEHGRVQHGLGAEGLAGKTAGRAPGTGRTRASTTRAREEGLAGKTAGTASGMGRTRAREIVLGSFWPSGGRFRSAGGWIPVVFKEKARVPPRRQRNPSKRLTQFRIPTKVDSELVGFPPPRTPLTPPVWVRSGIKSGRFAAAGPRHAQVARPPA